MARRTTRFATSLTIALAITACGGDDGSGPDDDVRTIEMRTGNSFAPANLSIEAGTTVRWVNEDAIAHNTTSSTAGLWNSGNLQPDATFQRTFNDSGSFPYTCTIHPGMSGTITVN